MLREYENANGTWSVVKDYVYRGSHAIAAYTRDASPRNLTHLHTDHLGTVRAVTDANGTRIAYHVFYPFGEEATAISQSTERLKFTGHERDLGNTGSAADDIDYMHARYYNAQIGRFLGFDPAGGSMHSSQPQTWNRHTYGLNNPLKYIDPDGLEVTYSTDGLRQFYEKAADRNSEVRATLDLYSGALNLHIQEGDPGTFEDGSPKGGVFSVSVIDVGYDGNFEQIEAADSRGEDPFYPTTAKFVTTVEFRNNATITLPSGAPAEAKLHELGHADQRARNPLQYLKDSHEEATRGKTHSEQPAEIYANEYAERAKKKSK